MGHVLQRLHPFSLHAKHRPDHHCITLLSPGALIEDIVVGSGPCGELRYPSYLEGNGWRFPGLGEFQCYDRRALASLAAAAREAGHPEWGYGGPHDAGTYNSLPEETGFFRRGGSWDTPYGAFFLDWYSRQLTAHGDRIMALANQAFGQLQSVSSNLSNMSTATTSQGFASTSNGGGGSLAGANGSAADTPFAGAAAGGPSAGLQASQSGEAPQPSMPTIHEGSSSSSSGRLPGQDVNIVAALSSFANHVMNGTVDTVGRLTDGQLPANGPSGEAMEVDGGCRDAAAAPPVEGTDRASQGACHLSGRRSTCCSLLLLRVCVCCSGSWFQHVAAWQEGSMVCQ